MLVVTRPTGDTTSCSCTNYSKSHLACMQYRMDRIYHSHILKVTLSLTAVSIISLYLSETETRLTRTTSPLWARLTRDSLSAARFWRPPVFLRGWNRSTLTGAASGATACTTTRRGITVWSPASAVEVSVQLEGNLDTGFKQISGDKIHGLFNDFQRPIFFLLRSSKRRREKPAFQRPEHSTYFHNSTEVELGTAKQGQQMWVRKSQSFQRFCVRNSRMRERGTSIIRSLSKSTAHVLSVFKGQCLVFTEKGFRTHGLSRPWKGLSKPKDCPGPERGFQNPRTVQALKGAFKTQGLSRLWKGLSKFKGSLGPKRGF